MDGHEIVPPPAHGQRSRKIGRLKIRYEKNDRTPRHDLVQVIKCQRRLRAASLRLKKQNLPDEPQCVRAALFWWDKKLDAIREENQPNLIVVPNRAEGEQTRNLRRQLAFGLRCAAKIS